MIAWLLTLVLAAAADAPKPQGVWRGSLGKQPIVACFDDSSGSSYYYESRRRDIALWEDGADFEEHLAGEEPTGRWRITSLVPEFVATWTSPDGKRSLPIRMKPVAKPGKGADCQNNPAYDGPRLASASLAPATVKAEHGVKLRREKVRDAEVSLVQLELAGPAGEGINAELRKEFRELLGMAYSCSQEFSSETSVEFADARWIVLQEDTGYYCGGAHPESFLRSIVFERASGRRVDTSKWLREVEPNQVDPALRSLLSRRSGAEADCSESWKDGFAVVRVWPSARGLTFRPDFPYVATACEADVELSLEQAAPFLTAAAKRDLAPKP